MQSEGGILYKQIEGQLPGFIQTDHTKFVQFVEKYYEFLELNLLTFTDLDLNEDKVLQESADVTYTVTVTTGNNAYSNDVNKFYINGAVSPDISLDPTKKTIFDQGDQSLISHYLLISNTKDGKWTPDGTEIANTEVTYFSGIQEILFTDEAGNTLVTEDNVDICSELTDVARTIIEPNPDNAGKTFYYYCNTHSGMGGSITFSNTSAYVSLENGNTETTNTNSNYIDFENPNRQGEQFLSGEIVLGANSGAKGIVRGKSSTTQIYVEETNAGAFQVGERITGNDSRVTANVSSYLRNPLNAARNLKAFQDVDKAPLGFVELFRKEFLHGLPGNMLSRKQDALKRIKDFYRAKGNEDSFRYIFRLLYAKEDITFYYPSDDVLRLSDGRWTLDKSVKIATADANNIGVFVGRKVVGEISNVTALVERSQSYQIGATGVTELYLSGIDANNATSGYSTFTTDETLTTTTADDNGDYGTANTTGLLESINIDAGGSNYTVGEDILVSGGGGSEAAAKVASVSDATISQFDIIDAGDGYVVGDTVSFINEGTGGTGGAARVNSIIPTFTTIHISEIINSFKENKINADGYAAPWGTFTRNNHITSNTTTSFTAAFDGASGSAPKEGDLIISFQIPQMLLETGEGNIDIEESGSTIGNLLTEESAENISTYTPDRSFFGTVISATASPATVTYAVGSVTTSNLDGSINIRGFRNNDAVVIYDLTKKSDGTAIDSAGNNAVFYATGGSFNINGTPTANTDVARRGMATVTDVQIGAIRTIQVLSSGQGYTSIPQVSVANNIIESYKADVSKVGANSVFVKLASTTANIFTANTRVENDAQTAIGVVLDYIDKPTTFTSELGGSQTLVDTGNTYLRVQMTTANSFSANERITAYVNEQSGNPVGIGDFQTANITTPASGTTATFVQEAHGYAVGEKVVLSSITTGISADDNIFNNTYVITTTPNANYYTVNLTADPTTSAVNNAKIRKVVTANLSSSNTVFANTGIAGNNAVIEIASIAIGAIQSVTIVNFGANYTTSPTLDATGSGDGNATLSAQLGALAEYAGYFDGNYGLLSTTGKFQDNYYYQDFSYVIKTDVDVKTYRKKILDLVHPSGMVLFGEILISSDTAAKMFANNARNPDSIIANTTHGIDVPLYRHHDIKILNKDTQDSNVLSTVASTLYLPTIFPPTANRAIDAQLESPHTDFDLILERNIDGIALENADDTLIFETLGELLLENDVDGRDRFIEETNDFVVNEDGTGLLLFEITDAELQLVYENGDHPITEGTGVALVNISLEDDSGIIQLETNTPGAPGNILSENTISIGTGTRFETELAGSENTDAYFELEVSDGGGLPTYRPDLLGYTQIEDNVLTETIKIMQEQDYPSYILNEDTDWQIVQEADFGNISLETANDHFITLEDGTGVIALEGDAYYILLDQDNALSQNRVLYEEEKISYHLVNAHGGDVFSIRAEDDGVYYFIRQEGSSPADYGDTILLEDGTDSETSSTGGRLFGFDASGSEDLITLERHDWVTDTTMKGEETLANGYSLPQIQMPYAETGSVKIDFGPAYDLLLEDGSYLILEDPNAQAYPTYLAFENTMQEEVSKDYVVTVSTGTVNIAHMIALESEIFDPTEVDVDLQLEDGSGNIQLEDGSGNIIMNLILDVEIQLEDGSGYVLLEDGSGNIIGEESPISQNILLIPGVIELEGSLDKLLSETGPDVMPDVRSQPIDLTLTPKLTVKALSNELVYEDTNYPIGLEESTLVSILFEDGTGSVVVEGDSFGFIVYEDEAVTHGVLVLEKEDVPYFSITSGSSAFHHAGTWGRIDEFTIIGSLISAQVGGKEEFVALESVDIAQAGVVLLEDDSGKVITERSVIPSKPDMQPVEVNIPLSTLRNQAPGDEVVLEDGSGVVMLEGSYIGLEDDTGGIGLEHTYGRLTEEDFGRLATERARLINEMNWATVESDGAVSNYSYEARGELRLTGGEEYELVAESGDKFVTESVETTTSIQPLLTEAGDYLVQESDQSSRIIGEFSADIDQTAKILSADYGRKNEAIGTNTFFEIDFAAPLVLEDGYNVTLENSTPQNYIIVLENSNDRIYDGILLEDDTYGKVISEEEIQFETERLVFHDILDLVTEEDNILSEELDNILQEDYVFDNIVQTIPMEDFVANIALEGVNTEDSILLESYTPDNTEGAITVGANTYAKQWGDSQITQSGTTVSIASGTFPYGASGGTLRYANGTVTDITALNAAMTQITVDNSATVGSAQDYRIYYGDFESVPIVKPRVMKCESETTDTNGIGREYQFIISDWINMTVQEFYNRHGNDIVLEDGERILTEDGETSGQDENVILLDDTNTSTPTSSTIGKLGYEGDNFLLFEDMHYNEKMLIHDAERFRIKAIISNTNMTMASTETDVQTPRSDITYFIEREERILS